jgi:hypothetical protein
MKTAFKTLLYATIIILPLSSCANHRRSSTENSSQNMSMMEKCPHPDKMKKMQRRMDKMMQEMQVMSDETKNKAMKKRMTKVHDEMEEMMDDMQEMHNGKMRR